MFPPCLSLRILDFSSCVVPRILCPANGSTLPLPCRDKQERMKVLSSSGDVKTASSILKYFLVINYFKTMIVGEAVE